MKAPKAGTKQAKANEIVLAAIAGKEVTKELKRELIAQIQAVVGMSKSGATTYMHNALRFNTVNNTNN